MKIFLNYFYKQAAERAQAQRFPGGVAGRSLALALASNRWQATLPTVCGQGCLHRLRPGFVCLADSARGQDSV